MVSQAIQGNMPDTHRLLNFYIGPLGFLRGFSIFVLEVDFVDGQRAVDLNEMQCRMIGFNVPKQPGWWKLDDVCAKVWRTGIIQDFTYQNDLINQSRCKIGILQKKMKWI